MKQQLETLMAEIKTLSDKSELTAEEQKQLEGKISQAEALQMKIKIAELEEAQKSVNIEEQVTAAVTKAMAEVEGKFKTPPNVMKAANLGDPDPSEDFYRWIATGKGQIKMHLNKDAQLPYLMINRSTGVAEVKYLKAAIQEGTTTEGGYLVPSGELGRIISKRDEVSLVSRLGASTFDTDRDVYNIPTEGTAMTKFTIVAEEGAVSAAENEPTFGQEAVTLYKFMKVIKLSAEIEADFNSGLANFLTEAIGRAWGITENYYVQVGAGTTEPEGVFVGGTAGLTLDSASAIGLAEVPELLGKLKMAYRPGAVLVMNRQTLAYLRGLNGNQFSFGPAPTSSITAGGEDLGIGYPVIGTEDAATIAASAKSMLFGNFALYGWVRNRSLEIQRMNELYRGTDQIGLHCKFRAGGEVLQAEAFQYATHPTA